MKNIVMKTLIATLGVMAGLSSAQASISECDSLHVIFGGSHYTDFVGTEKYFYFLNPRELQGQHENGLSKSAVTETAELDSLQWEKMIRVEQGKYYLIRSSETTACAVKVSTQGEILEAHGCPNPLTSFDQEQGCR